MIAVADLPPPPDRSLVRRALLSVSDKTGLVPFAERLAARGVELLSTGGTAAALRAAGLAVTDVSAVTGFPEILGGRVKSLHPAVHGGILARRTSADDDADLAAHGIGAIDLVAVNLYPFREATAGGAEAGVTDAVAAENVDIGGPAMLRAAAKNFAFVAAVVDPADYAAVADELDAHDGTLGLDTRRRLAGAAFAHTADYDRAVAAFFAGAELETPRRGVSTGDHATGDHATGDRATGDRATGDHATGDRATGMGALPSRLVLDLPLALPMRYGENPHQAAALYGDPDARYRVLHGKPLSYNNVLDLTSALNLIAEFDGAPPTVAILKHTTPCGVGQAGSLAEAYARAFATDTQSPFGGIVVTNRPLDRATAEAADAIFTEIVVAPDFEDGVLDFLGQKAGRRIVRFDPAAPRPALVVRSGAGGVLAQTPDAPLAADVRDAWSVATERAPTDAEWADLDFAWRVCKHVTSNAIVYARGGATLGLGGGQTSRIAASQLAVTKGAEAGLDFAGCVVASDAFFPFADGLVAAADAGAVACVQPGGSVRDAEVVEAANARGIAMVLTGQRHFRH